MSPGDEDILLETPEGELSVSWDELDSSSYAFIRRGERGPEIVATSWGIEKLIELSEKKASA